MLYKPISLPLLLICTDCAINSMVLFPGASEKDNNQKPAVTPAHCLLTGTVGDWIVCISLSVAESHAMEALKLIKSWRRPPPPKQLVTSQSLAASTEAPAAARQRLEVPSLLRRAWQEQLYRRTDKTHRNQWMLSSSTTALVGCCCQDAGCFVAV